MEMRRVVIGVDFSDPSIHGARWAVRHFAQGLEIVLVHVITLPAPPRFMVAQFPELANIAESARAAALNRLREITSTVPSADVRLEVREGNPAEQIAAVAREVGADVIIVGKHSVHAGLLHRLGSTADRLVRVSPAPVLLATGVRDMRPRRIVAALDVASITPFVVEWSRALAARFDAQLTALHVVGPAVLTYLASVKCVGAGGAVEPAPVRADIAEQASAWMHQAFDHGAERPVSTDVAFGSVAHEIVNTAERLNADLIVLGRHGSGLGRHLRLGDVARQVLHGTRCPVLVVVEPEDTIVDDEAAR